MINQQVEPIQLSMDVPVSVNRAYGFFTEQMHTWWPKEYTWSGDVLETIAIQPETGGRCFERGPHNFELDWGRVLVWEPPHRLVFTWQISPERVPQPDPDKASQIELRFSVGEKNETHLEFKHRDIANHGEGSAAYRDALAAPQGWSYILDRYAAALNQKGKE